MRKDTCMPGFHNRYTGMPGVNSYSMPGLANCDTGHKGLMPGVSAPPLYRIVMGQTMAELLFSKPSVLVINCILFWGMTNDECVARNNRRGAAAQAQAF